MIFSTISGRLRAYCAAGRGSTCTPVKVEMSESSSFRLLLPKKEDEAMTGDGAVSSFVSCGVGRTRNAYVGVGGGVSPVLAKSSCEHSLTSISRASLAFVLGRLTSCTFVFCFFVLELNHALSLRTPPSLSPGSCGNRGPREPSEMDRVTCDRRGKVDTSAVVVTSPSSS
jgi:hypothetical protein